jgi:RNA polymerase-binding transcription factor DksA
VTDRAASLRDAHERATRRVIELTDLLGAIVDSSALANLDDEHDPEGATVGYERAQVSALLEGARTQLAELDEAFERLRGGTYGTCERCGREIAEERLDAQPAARACIACVAERR